MLRDRISMGLSGRGGKGFGIYKIGSEVITEQERHLLIFALKYLASDDEQARRKLRWKETNEWEGILCGI